MSGTEVRHDDVDLNRWFYEGWHIPWQADVSLLLIQMPRLFSRAASHLFLHCIQVLAGYIMEAVSKLPAGPRSFPRDGDLRMMVGERIHSMSMCYSHWFDIVYLTWRDSWSVALFLWTKQTWKTKHLGDAISELWVKLSSSDCICTNSVAITNCLAVWHHWWPGLPALWPMLIS